MIEKLFQIPQRVMELWEFRKGIRLGPGEGFAGYTMETLPDPFGRNGTIVYVTNAGDGTGGMYMVINNTWKEVEVV